jgi:tetratricopeptide (TPR) repeat protein
LRAGEPEAAAACFGAAAALARRIGDPELLARAALGMAGLGVEIIDVDPDRVALLEEALDGLREGDAVLASQLLARLAVELYYAPTRDRSEVLSAEAVAVARSAGDARAVAAALNARHVALWRPDRLDERLQAADEMLEAARAAGERQLELQARNWRAVDIFELGDMQAWRAEVRRHGALAEELRLPSFTWYTPLWAAVDAPHRGSFEEGRALREQALAEGRRAGDRNASLFALMLEIQEALLRGDFSGVDLELVEERIATSPAAVSWRCGYSWFLAELGRLDEAAGHLRALAADGFAGLPFDANWLSAVGECAEASAILGDPDSARRLYALIAPYEGRPLIAGRAISSYGSCDRHLGALAATLGRMDDAVAHYENAIRLDRAAGLRPWVLRAQRGLVKVLLALGDDERARELEAAAGTDAQILGGAPSVSRSQS